MESLTKQTSTLGASSTRPQQAEFPAFVNTLSAPRAAAAVSKRAPGRPKGSRVRVLFVGRFGARWLCSSAAAHLRAAQSDALFASVNRRAYGSHSWAAIEYRRRAKASCVFAICYTLAAVLRFRGGVL